MKSEIILKKLNSIFFIILIIFLIYSFDYSLGWGMNLMFPNIYFFTFGTGNSGYKSFVWNESGLIENFQVIILFITLIQLSFLYFRTKKTFDLFKYFIVINIIGITYIFLEEISWGQHFFNYNSPSILLNKESFLYNKQGEFNIHNISNLFNEIPRTLILIWCCFSIPILRFINYSKYYDLNLAKVVYKEIYKEVNFHSCLQIKF